MTMAEIEFENDNTADSRPNVIGNVFSGYNNGIKFVEEWGPRKVDHQSIPSKYWLPGILL